jgi:carbon storage regulator
MLVLTRKVGQKLMIDQHIEITILEVRPDGVKIGIQAPKHIRVLREEIYQEVIEANKPAPASPADLDNWLKKQP